MCQGDDFKKCTKFGVGYWHMNANAKKGLPNDQVESLIVHGKNCQVTMWQHGNNKGWEVKMTEGKFNCAAIKAAGGKCNDMSSF
jgi:hypothetical protein